MQVLGVFFIRAGMLINHRKMNLERDFPCPRTANLVKPLRYLKCTLR